MEEVELDGASDLCDSPHIMLELASELELKKDNESKKRKREDDNRLDESEDILRIKPPQARPSGYDDDDDDDVHKRFRRMNERGDEKWKKRSHHESDRLERLERERRRLENERHRHLDKIQKERDHERRQKYGRTDSRRRADRKEHRKSAKNPLSHNQRKSKPKDRKATKTTASSSSPLSFHPQRDDKKRDHKRKARRSPMGDIRGSDEKRDCKDERGESETVKDDKEDDISEVCKDNNVVDVDRSSNRTSDKSSPVYDLYHFARSKFDDETDDEKKDSDRRKEGNSGGGGGGGSVSLHERNDSSIRKADADKIESPLNNDDEDDDDDDDDDDEAKELKTPGISGAYEDDDDDELSLPPYYPAIQGCRNVEEFHCLNRINEGTYGVVYRAIDLKLREVVALKRLKMEKEKDGFPITSLREIKLLMKARHPNIVTIKEVVVGSNMDKIYLVMEYVEHDLKSLMESMKEPFTIGEVKTLLIQLLRGVQHLHDNWIIHRDLKTSNLLLSHSGILKIGDFGLAREYGSPLKPYTPIVVTLWYRSPELLLGTKMYSTAVDMWSVGCIFGEFFLRKPLFPGSTQVEQLNSIFKDLGSPNEKIWPGLNDLSGIKKANFNQYQFNQLRRRFGAQISEKGFQLMNSFLTYSPEKRMTSDLALTHEYFTETPLPTHPSMFPTWPAKSELCRTRKSPKAPSGGKAYPKADKEDPSKKSSHGFLFKFPAV